MEADTQLRPATSMIVLETTRNMVRIVPTAEDEEAREV